jgi:maleate isomerase
MEATMGDARARIGLIVPSGNVVMEPDFWRWVPEGVTVHTSRMGRGTPEVSLATLELMLQNLDAAASLLADAAPDLMVFGCTSASFMGGKGADRAIAQRIQDKTGIPAVTTSTAVLEALRHLGARSVAILTPYVAEINGRVRVFCEQNGVAVRRLTGLEIRTTDQIAAVPPAEIARRGREADAPDADVLFISCTQFRGWDAVPLLEGDLGKPVVTSNQASLWAALGRLGLRGRMDGGGRLFEG